MEDADNPVADLSEGGVAASLAGALRRGVSAPTVMRQAGEQEVRVGLVTVPARAALGGSARRKEAGHGK